MNKKSILIIIFAFCFSISIIPNVYASESSDRVLEQDEYYLSSAEVERQEGIIGIEVKTNDSVDVYVLTSEGLNQFEQDEEISDVSDSEIICEFQGVTGPRVGQDVKKGYYYLVVLNTGSQDVYVHTANIYFDVCSGITGAYTGGLIMGLTIGIIIGAGSIFGIWIGIGIILKKRGKLKMNKKSILIIIFAFCFSISIIPNISASESSDRILEQDEYYLSSAEIEDLEGIIFIAADTNDSVDVFVLTSEGLNQFEQDEEISDVSDSEIIYESSKVVKVARSISVKKGYYYLVVLNTGSQDVYVHWAYLNSADCYNAEVKYTNGIFRGLIIGIIIGASSIFGIGMGIIHKKRGK